MSRLSLEELRERLSDRDLAVLRSIEDYRLLGTRQIQRLHFADHHTTQAAARACVRVLARLRQHGLLARLKRRIGGVRQGSAGFIWHLGPAGERLLRDLRAEPHRRRYTEPSRHFVNHTLAVAELAVRLREAERQGRLETVRVQTEPGTWQRYLTPAGGTRWLKPDLYAITTTSDFEEHWFIEADLDTERLSVVVRQCLAYQAYRSSGRHQTTHGLFPAVLWVAPSHQRATGIRDAIAADPALRADIFRVCSSEDFLDQITAMGLDDSSVEEPATVVSPVD